jgi:hypothetical protein
VDHEYLRNVILGGELGFEWDEYQQPSQQATDVYAGVSARWVSVLHRLPCGVLR